MADEKISLMASFCFSVRLETLPGETVGGITFVEVLSSSDASWLGPGRSTSALWSLSSPPFFICFSGSSSARVSFFVLVSVSLEVTL